MTLPDLGTTSVSGVARLVPAGGLVLAATDDGRDRRYGSVREAAVEVALAAAARILLFDTSAPSRSVGRAQARLFAPLAGAGGRPGRIHTGSRRRDLLLDQALAIEARSVGTLAWLAATAGPAGIAEAVQRTGASLVLLPAELDRTGVSRRVIRRTLSYYACRVGAPLVSVDLAGRLCVVPPLGARVGLGYVRALGPAAVGIAR